MLSWEEPSVLHSVNIDALKCKQKPDVAAIWSLQMDVRKLRSTRRRKIVQVTILVVFVSKVLVLSLVSCTLMNCVTEHVLVQL